MHQAFRAMAQGRHDFEVDVGIAKDCITNDTLMTIMATGEAIYITKAQAMAFFGLVEPSKLVLAAAAAVECECWCGIAA